jgi:protein Tex
MLQSLTETEIYIVNESGASVYSASKTAQEEFPDLDSLDR